jgi:hypothetical protein
MSKRFTDTGLHREPWFRKLNPTLKCATRFLFDECDSAGVWVIDMETMSYFVGEDIILSELLSCINSDKANRIEMYQADKIFIPGFVEFQYGTLSEKSPPHRPIIKKLKKYGLYEKVLIPLQTIIDTPSTTPYNTLEEKEKEKDKEKEKETEKDFGKSENLFEPNGQYLVPRMSGIYLANNQNYLPDKERDFKPLYSIATFLCKQGNVKGPPENHLDQVCEAWEAISRYVATDKFYAQKSISTISNHIQEITQKAKHGDQSTKTARSTGISDDKIKDAISKRFRATG